MARVPVAFALVAAGISVGAFIDDRFGANPYPSSRWDHVGFLLLWLAVALSIALGRRASAVAGIAQVAAALAAVACVVVALVKLYGPMRIGVGDEVLQAFQWIGEAQAMGLAALAFGLAGARVRAPAISGSFLVLVIAAVSCLGYALSSNGISNNGWWAAATTAAVLAGSAAARMERFALSNPR